MDRGNREDPLDVRVRGVRGTLPGEGELGPFCGGRLWPARVRLRMLGVMLPICAAVVAALSLLVAAVDPEVLGPFGGGWLLYSLAVCALGSLALGALLYASTATLRVYRRRLLRLRWATAALVVLCLAGFLGIRGVHGEASVLPLSFAAIFLVVWLVMGADRRALRAAARTGKGGDPHVL